MNLGRYNKLVVAVVAGVIGWATLVVNSPSHAITAQEWIVGLSYLASALGVYSIANVPAVPAASTVVAEAPLPELELPAFSTEYGQQVPAGVAPSS